VIRDREKHEQKTETRFVSIDKVMNSISWWWNAPTFLVSGSSPLIALALEPKVTTFDPVLRDTGFWARRFFTLAAVFDRTSGTGWLGDHRPPKLNRDQQPEAITRRKLKRAPDVGDLDDRCGRPRLDAAG
jgi:hypothetical protein